MDPSALALVALVVFALYLRCGDDVAAWFDAMRRQRAAFRRAAEQRRVGQPEWAPEDGLMADPIEDERR